MNTKQNEYVKIIREVLSDKRFAHSVNVAEMCVKLAERHGCDAEKAYIAGILHDIRKEASPEILRAEVSRCNFAVDEVELATPKLWHAISGAYYVKEALKIADGDIIAAIRFHTIGCANMTLLQKIVYLGDLVSKERDFKDVEKYRGYAFENLDCAMYRAVKYGISETLDKPGKIPVYTLQAYNFYFDFA